MVLVEYYKDKNILLTGCTGFVGMINHLLLLILFR